MGTYQKRMTYTIWSQDIITKWSTAECMVYVVYPLREANCHRKDEYGAERISYQFFACTCTDTVARWLSFMNVLQHFCAARFENFLIAIYSQETQTCDKDFDNYYKKYGKTAYRPYCYDKYQLRPTSELLYSYGPRMVQNFSNPYTSIPTVVSLLRLELERLNFFLNLINRNII
ncbi:unnamed protein product [Gongylonema pulchrum]|uniref:Lipocalin n=1 Tax=Gongylonema pulchrum TaxID=637853 RepID=A0A183DLR7_9BILA|nr:unnamed protein product [Gongylonema pulchrum]